MKRIISILFLSMTVVLESLSASDFHGRYNLSQMEIEYTIPAVFADQDEFAKHPSDSASDENLGIYGCTFTKKHLFSDEATDAGISMGLAYYRDEEENISYEAYKKYYTSITVNDEGLKSTICTREISGNIWLEDRECLDDGRLVCILYVLPINPHYRIVLRIGASQSHVRKNVYREWTKHLAEVEKILESITIRDVVTLQPLHFTDLGVRNNE